MGRDAYISSFAGTSEGDTEIVYSKDNDYVVKISGRNNSNYEFTITDGEAIYEFNYSFNNGKAIIELEK